MATSRNAKHGPCLLNPAVVMMFIIGCERLPIAERITSIRPLSRWAWNSSTVTPCGFNPSRVLLSELNALNDAPACSTVMA